MMITLTIYTNDFDSRENICGKGMSGKVFLEEFDDNRESGASFSSIDEALDYCETKKTSIDRIDFNYLGKDGTQKFWKFNMQR